MSMMPGCYQIWGVPTLPARLGPRDWMERRREGKEEEGEEEEGKEGEEEEEGKEEEKEDGGEEKGNKMTKDKEK